MSDVYEITHRGATLAFTDAGSGPTVVLGHSFLCSRSMWAGQVPVLAERYRVINVDYRGHGASSAITRPLTLYDLVDDVLAILDHRGVERAVWAGLSVGGFVALRAALTAPQRVPGLVLVDTDGGAETWWPRTKYRILGGVARGLGVGAVGGAAARHLFGATTRKTRPELVRSWRQEFRQFDVASTLCFLRAVAGRDDLGPRLGAIDVPSVVIVGAEDVSLPPARSRRLAAQLPNATFHEIPGAGHLSAVEQPELVTAAMLEFLGTVDWS